jgi:hypothetical protein
VYAPGVLALLLAAVVGALVPVLFGTPRAQVHITWRGVTETERARLEERFRLSEAAPRDDGAWSYVPLDTSRDTLRALVRLDAVAATDGIDRTAFRISGGAPLTARRGGLVAGAPPLAARLSKLAAYALALAGVLLLVLGRFSRAAASPSAMLETGREWVTDPRAIGTALRDWLGRGVPLVTARSLAMFRVALGVLVTAYVWSEPVYPELLGPYELGAATGVYGAIVRALAEHPALVDGLRFGVLATGTAFAAGLRPRASFAALCTFVMLWACVLTLRTTSHAVSALLLAMVCLLPARWGAAWRVDTLLRRRIRQRTFGPAKAYSSYAAGNFSSGDGPDPGEGTARGRDLTSSDPRLISGFPIWVPVLVFGVTFAAAAWAKLQNGLGWILNGTVKYHFISDMEHAWVDWGVRMTESHAAAVALSAGAVLVEGILITAALSRSVGYRLAMGIAAFGLLAAFALFQGVIWPGWWILLLGFLPWTGIPGPRRPVAQSATRLRPVELGLVLFVIGQQVYASAMHVEARPLVTAYDMYSTTYDTRDDYEAASNLVYRVVGITRDGAVDFPGCVVDDAAARAFESAVNGDERAQARMRGLLRPCLDRRQDVTMMQLEGDRQVYHWEQRRFEWRRRLEVIGPVNVDWMRE